jgi:uncharacterized protein DUF2637
MTRTKHAPKTKGSWLSLATASLVFIALAALMGWAGSFIGLHGYGMQRMTGFTQITAWAIPGAYDGAALACTFAVYRASINGRSAARGRVMMFAFTGVSSWVNWTHQTDHTARLVAAGLPIAAVVVFDFLMAELRADWEAAHGRRAFRIRPALLILRYLVDRKGTREAFRQQITAIPVSALAGLGADLAAAAKREPGPAQEGPAQEGPAQEGPAQEGPADTIPDYVPDTIMSLPTARPDAGPARGLAPIPEPRPAPIPEPLPSPAADSSAPAPITPHANGARPGPAALGLSSSEGVDANQGVHIIDVVKAVYRDDWDTATITKVVMDNIPDANPETVRRSIGKARKWAQSRAQSGPIDGPGRAQSGPTAGPGRADVGGYL